MSVCFAFAQDETSFIENSFATYMANNYQERVFLHTDKTIYITGEILWFKAYITDAANNSFSLLSKICYVEILSNDNKPLLQGKISIDSGGEMAPLYYQHLCAVEITSSGRTLTG